MSPGLRVEPPGTESEMGSACRGPWASCMRLHVWLRLRAGGRSALASQCMRQSPAWLSLGTSYGVRRWPALGAGGPPLPEVGPPLPAAPDQQTWWAGVSLPRPWLLRGQQRPPTTEGWVSSQTRCYSSESSLGATQAAWLRGLLVGGAGRGSLLVSQGLGTCSSTVAPAGSEALDLQKHVGTSHVFDC